MEPVVASSAGIRANANQAFCSGLLCLAGGNAYWAATVFGDKQAAAFTFAGTTTTLNNSSLYLKVGGTLTLGAYQSGIRVQYNAGQVTIATTTNTGLTFTTAGSFAGTFASGDTMTAQVDAAGAVFVWKTSGATTTLLGFAFVPAPFTRQEPVASACSCPTTAGSTTSAAERCRKTERRGASNHHSPLSEPNRRYEMTTRSPTKTLSRRRFFKMAGGAVAAAAGMGILPTPFKKMLDPVGLVQAADRLSGPNCSMPAPTAGSALPADADILGPSRESLCIRTSSRRRRITDYIFGFRNVTWLRDATRANQKNHAQHYRAAILVGPIHRQQRFPDAADQPGTGAAPRPVRRAHHPLARLPQCHPVLRRRADRVGGDDDRTHLPYIYRPRDPGTYMFHCHVEDVEHVHMGMTGPVYVRARRTKRATAPAHPWRATTGVSRARPIGYAYNDGVALGDPKLDRYDREFCMQLSEVWGDSHWADAHIQLPEWSDYRADFALLDGWRLSGHAGAQRFGRSVSPRA